MKKTVLFSLIVVMGYGCFDGVNAAESCRKTSSGATICGSLPVGSQMETNRCKGDYDKKNDRQNYKKIGAPCSPANAPANSGRCIKSNKPDVTSCAAKKCNDGYLLYTTNTRHEISVIGTNDRVGSQGICTNKQSLKTFCETKCSCDDPGYKCILNEVQVENLNPRQIVDAYIGEEACICVADQIAPQPVVQPDVQPDVPPEDEKECVYNLTVNIQCNNGNYYTENATIHMSKTQAQKMTCEIWKSKMQQIQNGRLDADLQKEIDEMQDLLNEKCGNASGDIIVMNSQTGGSVGTVNTENTNEIEIENAKRTLNNFFDKARKNASVWEKTDGSFNTARLASDLTAGVVLGTVGGVVSGHIIKKNQIKKGFEGLHCTVGGQTVADWGDEFSVGFRR